MANLDPLIRVRKHNVEQKQKVLAELYKKAEELKNQRDALEAQLAIESEKSRELEIDMLGYFAAYVKETHRNIEAIDQERSKVEKQIRFAQEQLREAFAEQKKIEIIDKRRKDEEQAAQDKKESSELDEIAIDGHRRKGEG